MESAQLCSHHKDGRPIVIPRQFEPLEVSLEVKLEGRIMTDSMKVKCRYTPDGFCWHCTKPEHCEDGKKERTCGPYNTPKAIALRQRNQEMLTDYRNGMTYKELGLKYGLQAETAAQKIRQLRD